MVTVAVVALTVVVPLPRDAFDASVSVTDRVAPEQAASRFLTATTTDVPAAARATPRPTSSARGRVARPERSAASERARARSSPRA